MVAEGVLSAMVTLIEVAPLVPLAGLMTGVAVAEEPVCGPEKFVMPLTPQPQTSASVKLKAPKIWRFDERRLGREAPPPEAVTVQTFIFQHLDIS